jgi:hypothetical protein
MYTEQEKFITWLKSDLSNGECIMNRIIDIYADLETHLVSNKIYIKEDFNTFLMRLAYFLYNNSSAE